MYNDTKGEGLLFQLQSEDTLWTIIGIFSFKVKVYAKKSGDGGLFCVGADHSC